MQEFLLENILNAGYHLLLSFLASQFYPQKVSYEGGKDNGFILTQDLPLLLDVQFFTSIAYLN